MIRIAGFIAAIVIAGYFIAAPLWSGINFQRLSATTLTLTELGPDLITNGAMAADTDWTKGTGWTIPTPVASSDGTQAGDADLTQTISITNGLTYETIYTLSAFSAGNVVVVIGDVEGTDRASNATFTENVVAGAGGDVDLRADVNFIGSVDDVIVKLANISWSLTSGVVSTVTLTGNRVIDNPTNMTNGGTYILNLIQDATGSRTVTWGSAYQWPGGTAPTLTTGANAVDIVSFISDGTNMNGVAQLDFQ